ncbi:hypothetical protein SAMN05421766_101889 [Zobellia uliginosa]|uniref:Uncharacterized protein n=1 Tax=Zobellia uliginosa TaxID=143224 RepID=A0ABY1KJU9_9FLAO|nr:hypothetical protein [Zobellia uliginosa]SIS42776.1 hypothetical protein SAMN05421766_101889 [Zobellia uliginosa]
MELHYSIYRKVKIYFNKVCGTLPYLEDLKQRSSLPEGKALIGARIGEFRLVQAQLVAFFINPGITIPYVPASRCLALKMWYTDPALLSPSSLAVLLRHLTKADIMILQEAGYIASEPLMPLKLGKLFMDHRERLAHISDHQEQVGPSR